MFRTSPSSITSPPCRIRNRNALVSSVYHTSPLFSALVTALDDGLNRHNPCPCHSCQALLHNKRTAIHHQDAPPSKRARTRSTPSSFTSTQSPVIHHCQWCAFSDLPSRQTCRQCDRRRTPPAMVQRFHVERTQPCTPCDTTATDIHTHTHTNASTSPISDAETLSFVREQLMEYSQTASPNHPSHPPFHCGLNYSQQYPSHPLHDLHVSVPLSVSVPVEQVTPHVQSAAPEYASPRSTIPDPAHFTDFESVCSPESLSMASKSIEHVHVHTHTFTQSHQTYPNEAELDVDKLIEEVSNDISQQSNPVKHMDSSRTSMVSSALSDVTSESAVELDSSEDAYEHSKAIDDQRALPDDNAAERFLNEMIMSDEEHNTGACNDIADLSLTFLDGMFPSLHEQDAC